MNTIHIHHVIEWLASDLRPVTEEELLGRIATTYGKDVRFTSCTEDQFPKERVVGFLLSRNKIVVENGLIRFNSQGADC